MKAIGKNIGDAGEEMGKVHLSLFKCKSGGKSGAEETDLMIEEIHKRATEVGPVLEGILHIHCEENMGWGIDPVLYCGA